MTVRRATLVALSASITAACACAIGSQSLPAQQTIDSARVRTTFEAVKALRADYERKHGRFVTVNGIRMHYLEWGNERGVPFVYAHGSAGSAYEIRSVAPRLVEAGYRVIATGLPRPRTDASDGLRFFDLPRR